MVEVSPLFVRVGVFGGLGFGGLGLFRLVGRLCAGAGWRRGIVRSEEEQGRFGSGTAASACRGEGAASVAERGFSPAGGCHTTRTRWGPLALLKKSGIFFFSVVNPVLEYSENCTCAAVTEYLSPQTPGVDFEALPVYCQFSHPFSFQISFTQIDGFLERGVFFPSDFPFFFSFFSWLKDRSLYCFCVS